MTLAVVREQIAAAAAMSKCHRCGCLRQTVAALADTATGSGELAGVLGDARAVLAPQEYDCLGCPVCPPALAANAFAEVHPEAAAGLDLCPTEAPAERSGWPPLPGAFHVVRYGAPVAVCTLHDAALAQHLADAAPPGLGIAGTLHTENLGIERIIRNTLANPNLRFLVLCGPDTRQAVGHLPGRSLAALFAGGVDDRGRIPGAPGRRPVVRNVTREQVEAFRRQVELIECIDLADAGRVVELVQACAARDPGLFAGAPEDRAPPRVDAREPRRLVLDPAGYFVVYPEARSGQLVVEHYTNAGVLDCVVAGRTPAAVASAAIERGLLTRLDHAAYLGRELARAEHSLEAGEPFVQDRAPGEPEAHGCGCAGACGPEATR
jgi:tetrahydromethanopterin S-methyltransferase subunit A